MSKERLLFGFKDIVEPRRFNNDAVSFMARHWTPQHAYKVPKTLTPNDIKKLALESKRLNIILNDLAVTLKKDRNEIQTEVAAMLEEIGMERKMFVIRWLGIFTIKVLCSMCTSVFVNERNIFSLKSTMGLNPVVFVPSHRSYADFVLMTYICFCYDIEFPAVAAGMDFHSMVAFGRIMRDTCAFYIRRTFATDKVYSAAFKQYVRTLVTKYHSPISFFIEGTRSRSGKSMAPKFGFMSMVLEPLFTREIPDITFVPVSISYDRVMEEKLFAYELLGVPKPKESTSGLLRALSILNENFGNIYVNIGTPFSALDYFGSSFKKSIHALKPVEIRDLSNDENQLIQKLSHEVVHRQQQGMIITSFQFVCVAIMVSLHNEKPMTVDELEEYVIWLSSVFKIFGALTFDYDSENVKKELTTLLATHKSLVTVDKNSKVRLVNSMPFLMTDEIKKKMKGHQLTEKTMSTVIPVVMTQLYINSVLHWTLSGLILQHIIGREPASKDVLLKQYRQMRILLKAEFPLNEETFMHEFDSSLTNLIDMNALRSNNGMISLGDNKKVHELFQILFWPFLSCVSQLGTILSKVTSIGEKPALKLVQEKFEWQLLNKEDIHPYCLSLDCIQNCIQGYCALNVVTKQRENNTVTYNVNSDEILNVNNWLSSLLPQKLSKFYINNPVILEQKGLLSRL